jgi:hypothetical protein
VNFNPIHPLRRVQGAESGKTGKCTLCEKVCQCFVAGRLFFCGNSVSFTNKTDHHNITVKMNESSLNKAITQPLPNTSINLTLWKPESKLILTKLD